MKSLDILSPEPSFFFEEGNRYSSTFGSCLSILTGLIFVCLTVFFGLDLVKRNSPEVSFSQVYNNDPMVDSEEFFLALSVHYGGGFDIVEIERKFEFKMTLIDTDTSRAGPTSTFTSFPMKPCAETKLFKEDKAGIQSTKLASDSNYYCPPDEMDYEMFGRFGSSKFSVLRYEVKYCSSRPDCYSPEFIAKNLTNIYYQGIFKDSYVDSFDFDNPIKDNFSQVLIPVSSEFKQSINVFFQELFFFGDNNWIFGEEEKIKSHIFDNYSFSLGNLEQDKTIVKVIIGFNEFEQQYKRKYIKLQDVLAQVGGTTKVLTIVFRLFLKVYSFFSVTKRRLRLYFSSNLVVSSFQGTNNSNADLRIDNTPKKPRQNCIFDTKFAYLNKFDKVFKSILSEDNLFELCALHEANKNRDRFEWKQTTMNLIKAKMSSKT